MIYITYEDLCRDVRENIKKIPHDICGVIGCPRSGMMPATIIAEHFNVGLSTPDTVIALGSVQDALSAHGRRRLRETGSKKLLVVEDTCGRGSALLSAKEKMKHKAFDGYELIFLVVYLEGRCDRCFPDIWLRDIREEAKDGPFGWAIYEWNLFSHGKLTERTLFDLDGVICEEPPDERCVPEYEAYIQNPVPKYIPDTYCVHICTYRLLKYADMTVSGLSKLGIKICDLQMATGRDCPAWKFKAKYYKDENWLLFVESSDKQARMIYELTGKPVICTATNKLYC